MGKKHRVGNIFGATNPPETSRFNDGVKPLATDARYDHGVDRSRRDGVHADVVRGQRLGHVFRQADSLTPAGDEASDGVGRRFHQLAGDWKQATLLISSGTEMLLHPAYQQIIGMGPEAVPLLVAELRRDPDHWFWALKAITGEDPVAEGDRGNLGRMTDAWLKWAEQCGY